MITTAFAEMFAKRVFADDPTAIGSWRAGLAANTPGGLTADSMMAAVEELSGHDYAPLSLDAWDVNMLAQPFVLPSTTSSWHNTSGVAWEPASYLFIAVTQDGAERLAWFTALAPPVTCEPGDEISVPDNIQLALEVLE